jgi:hypothetical protein
MNGNRVVYSKIEFLRTFILWIQERKTSVEVNKYMHIYCTNVIMGFGIESSMLSVTYFYKTLYKNVSM